MAASSRPLRPHSGLREKESEGERPAFLDYVTCPTLAPGSLGNIFFSVHIAILYKITDLLIRHREE